MTAETLRACRVDAPKAIRGYEGFVYVLAVLIVPLSIVSFVYTSLSNTISTQLKIANDLAVALHLEVDALPKSPEQAPPRGSVRQLQQFAVAMRAAHVHACQLDELVWDSVSNPVSAECQKEANRKSKGSDPNTQLKIGKGPEGANWATLHPMELRPNLNANSMSEVRSEVDRLTQVYQEIRLYATNVQGQVSMIWGAISTCILPVLYALLGACAAVLRAFSKQVEERTFAASYATPARFVVAAIGGGMVGIFNNFSLEQAGSLSPLAIAFLIG